MDNKTKPTDNLTDSTSLAKKVAEQDKGSASPDLEGWELTSEQRNFIESLQDNDSERDR